jgi:mannose-6-phosphate isomerase-like protein (cupin superfamily)
MMTNKVWFVDIEKETLRNKYWRKVLYTDDNLQVVVMSIPPGEELGWEVHNVSDQFFRIESGTGYLYVNKNLTKHTNKIKLKNGISSVVPRKIWHNVVNSSKTNHLKIYTIYTPPHHLPQTCDRTHLDELKREKIESKIYKK